MRFMILLKASDVTESGVKPDEDLLAEMAEYNEQLVRAGVLLAAEGLHPSSKGARVKFTRGARTVTVSDGPFKGSQELLAGFWIIDVKSRDEAVQWVARMPRADEWEAEVEIRQVMEMDDFGAALTPEVKEAEDRLRRQMAAFACARA